MFLFFPITLVWYFLAKNMNAKNNALVIMSIIFYAWGEPVYVLLMLFSAFVNYFAGLLMGSKQLANAKKLFLIIAVVIDLLLLGIFKYTGWICESLNALGMKLTAPEISLPIGISFYTFQTMTYTIDVYRGEVKVQRSYRNFLLYVSLFPQLIAGPIVRYSEIEPQLTERKTTYRTAFYGMTRFAFGLGKKVLIANYCGKIADAMLGTDFSTSSMAGVWLGVIMYSFQIYFDFCGYSDMAIGMGRIFGFRYSENFKSPYVSKSITEFWRRWHISLSSFFRDYVYIPLGGNRKGRKRQIFNLFVVWSLTGLWHGASWNFVFWGLYYFVLLVVEKPLLDRMERVPGLFRHILTLFLVAIGWTLFYFTDVSMLGKALSCMFGAAPGGFIDFSAKTYWSNNIPLLLLASVVCSNIPAIIGSFNKNLLLQKNGAVWKKKLYVIGLGALDFTIMALSIVSLVGSSYNPFLYFRF